MNETDVSWFPNEEDHKKTRKEQRIQIVTHLLSAHPDVNSRALPRGIKQLSTFHWDLHPFIMRDDGLVAKWGDKIDRIPAGWTVWKGKTK